MRYEVRAGAQTVRVETAVDGRMLLDGRVVAYDALELVAGRHWSIAVEGGAHEVVLLGADASTLPGGPAILAGGPAILPGLSARMLVDGVELAVTAADERTLAARRDRAAAGGGRREVRAPMPGFLKAVHVAEGEVVERSAALATLEAMKMENELLAPARGRVQRIAASAGAKVESGALILVLVDEPA